MEHIAPTLRLGFREVCVSLSLSQIDSIFQNAGLKASSPPKVSVSGQRRTRVEEYYAGMDWSSGSDTKRFLQAVGLTLSQSYLSEDTKDRLRRLCTEAGFIVSGHSVRFANPAIEWLWNDDGIFDSDHFVQYCERINQSAISDPETALGSSKELVEAVATFVLTRRNKTVRQENFPKLVKTAISELGLSREAIPEPARGVDAIKRILSAFNQIVDGMAELRNLYGTGHGRLRSISSIKPRHAKLVVGAAMTLSTFLLETLEERDREPVPKPPKVAAT